MMILGLADGVELIRWDDGKLLVLPEDQFDRIQAIFEKPVGVWQSVDRLEGGVPVAIEEHVEQLAPGTAEHAARVVLSLPGGILLEGDEAIPSDDSDEAAV